MRIWSLHPQYLDTKGLIALWRETLLAKYVLLGKTKGYKNHPQLNRFKKSKNPIHAINQYLSIIYIEAKFRNYKFDHSKIDWDFQKTLITVTDGQIAYEVKHLMKKLETRDIVRYKSLQNIINFDIVEMFEIIQGDVEDWEII